MKPQRNNNRNVRYFSTVFILSAFLLSACSQIAAFQQSSVAPAAHGKVKVKKDDNRNYNISVEVTDLAEVEKVYSKNFSYIVWMETDKGRTKNLGKLVSSKGFLSGQRKAKLETVSTIEPVKIFITAERDENESQPGNRTVLETRKF